MSWEADPTRLATDEKLAAFRLLDPLGQWQSIDEQRCCTLCKQTFTGHQVEVIGARLQCPTPDCKSAPADWKRHSSDCNGSAAPDPTEFSFLFQPESDANSDNQAIYGHDGR